MHLSKCQVRHKIEKNKTKQNNKRDAVTKKECKGDYIEYTVKNGDAISDTRRFSVLMFNFTTNDNKL